MNLDERKEFWDVLCSLDAKNLEEDVDRLSKTIKYPKYLYRYREVNLKSLEALRTNILYFSSANYYDDPFDTFLHIDLNSIQKEIRDVLNTPELLSSFINLVNDKLAPALKYKFYFENKIEVNPESLHDIINDNIIMHFLNYMGNIRNEIKKGTWSVCFSENGFNETLWLKYAKNHTGFVLMYDLEADDKMLCGKQDKCKTCAMMACKTSLYPIYYSNKKYDATEFAKHMVMNKIESYLSNQNIVNKTSQASSDQLWERKNKSNKKRVAPI